MHLGPTDPSPSSPLAALQVLENQDRGSSGTLVSVLDH